MNGNEIVGEVHTWSLRPGLERRYMSVTIPFRQADRLFRCHVFTIESPGGEQREAGLVHVRLLKRAIEAGHYTPAGFHAGLRQERRDWLTEKDGVATIRVPDRHAIPLTNGGHRFAALRQILQEALDTQHQELAAAVFNLPISIIILLDGKTSEDFVNLQISRRVDPTLIAMLKTIHRRYSEVDQPIADMALEVARLANTTKDSPFEELIRFDQSKTTRIYPFKSLFSEKWDRALGYYGLCKLGISMGMSAEQINNVVCAIFRTIKDRDPELFEEGKMLKTFPAGKRGAATMILGVATITLYRMKLKGETVPSEDTLTYMLESAQASLNETITGSFTANEKRIRIGQFTKDLFQDLDIEKHEGVPRELAEMFGTNQFAVSRLPKKAVSKAAKSSRKQDPSKVAAAKKGAA